jgi:hypothetical protein
MLICGAMGILFVLAFWGIVGLVLAAVWISVARGVITQLTGNSNGVAQKSARDRVVRNATLFPIGCLVWAACVFVFQGFINTTYLQRDIGIGDSYYCPLPNGYSILMIDEGDQGKVYNSKTDGSGQDDDVMSDVRELQVSGRNLLGASDTKWAQHFGQDNPPSNHYFLFDTQTGTRIDFATENELRIAAAKSGITLKLEPISKVYQRYRFTWFDAMAAVLLLLPPIVGLGFLIRSIVHLRKNCFSSTDNLLPAH